MKVCAVNPGGPCLSLVQRLMEKVIAEVSFLKSQGRGQGGGRFRLLNLNINRRLTPQG